MRVFVLQETDHDVSKAKKFGEIVYVFGNRRPSVFDHGRFRAQFIDRLYDLDFDAQKDAVAFVGTAVPAILCTSFMMEEFGGFNALLFNAATQSYLLRRLGDETD
jgi:hypothetical protein